MTEKRYDDSEIQKFYEKNKAMVDKLLDAEGEIWKKECGCPEDDERMKDYTGHIYNDYLDGRGRAREVFDENRDSLRDFVDDEFDYLYWTMREERERARKYAAEEREYAHKRLEEKYGHAKAEAERVRSRIGEITGFLADPNFQQHVIGVGIEMLMAFNAMIRSGPFPDSFKDAADRMEFCKNRTSYRKDPDCAGKQEKSSSGPEKIIITPAPKKEGAKKKQ